MRMVNRGQEGTEKELDLQEGGSLVTGGMMSETIDRRESVIITNE